MRSGETPSRPIGVRQQRKLQTREKLLATAREIIRRDGFAGLTARELARESGTAVGTVFVHFPDMTLLMETLLDEHITRALDGAFQTLPAEGDLVDQLVHVSRELFDSYDIEPDLSREYLASTAFRQVPSGPLEQGLDRFYQWVTERVEAAVSAHAIPDIEMFLAFTTFFSLYFSLLVAGLRGQLDRQQQVSLLDQALRRLFKIQEPDR